MAASRRYFLQGLGGCAACMAGRAYAYVLPTDLPPLVGEGYQPEDADERGIWQSLERIEESIRTSPQLLNAPDLHAYTRGVLERLVGRPAPELRLYLMRNSDFNASMFPSGMMIVHTGLMARVRSEAQYAAVLGHEAGHYFRKHTLQQYRSIRRKSAAMAVVGAAAGAAAGVASNATSWINAAYAINSALLLSVFQFSREDEAEADGYGISMMSRAGYSPGAAAEMWQQLIEERKASAAERKKRYRDRSASVISTHPPTEDRMADLADTADYLSEGARHQAGDRRAEWLAAIAPYRDQLLDEQVKLNDPGASLYLVESLAKDGWTGALRFQEGEIYRLRSAAGDDAKAATAYAASTELPDAPAEAWRAHGYALIKAGQGEEGRAALNRYLAMNPNAKDAGVIRLTLTQ
jgi:Zn-dependent protease with chaperone function